MSSSNQTYAYITMRTSCVIKRELRYTITTIVAYSKSCISHHASISPNPLYAYLVPHTLIRWGTAFYHMFAVLLVPRLNQLQGVNDMILRLEHELTKFHKLVYRETTRRHELFVNRLSHLLRQALQCHCQISSHVAYSIAYLESHIASRRTKNKSKCVSLRFISSVSAHPCI